MNVPKDLLYTPEHEWVKVEAGKARVGLTDYAQHALGDIVFVELPGIGDELAFGATFGVVESVKAASDVYSPLTGTVVEINTALEDTPEAINQDAYANWLVVLEISDESELEKLLKPEDYEKLLEQEG